ncbi:MAG: 3-phosphoglycerate dehydrogenase [Ruminococcus sp.]|nr:3-phosphoglycerate dehydrogenase [Ruminococcus sp.]
MYNILTLNKIAACGTDLFDKSRYTVGDAVENPTGILVRSAKMHDYAFGSELLAIGRAGAGTNNIPVEKCAEQGIVVFNSPGANANAVKELVIAGIFLASRKVTKAVAWAANLKDGETNVAAQVEKGKSQFGGIEATGKTLGVIGLGAIGKKVAQAANALGMNVVGTDPFLSEEAAKEMASYCKVVATKEEVYAAADFITLHVPCNDQTKGFVNADVINQMKDGVRILNFARAELVNDADLKAALASGKVTCYVTDFPNADTVNVDGIVAIPHLGASTEESEDNCAIMAANELIDYIDNGNIKNSVNFPNVSADADKKVCVLHKEGVELKGTVLATGTKKGYAYTILAGDADAEANKAIDGVIRVRVIG